MCVYDVHVCMIYVWMREEESEIYYKELAPGIKEAYKSQTCSW